MKLAALISIVILGVVGCASTSSNEDPFAEMFGGVPAERADRIAAGLSAHPLGSPQNPIRVNMPEGQRTYLSRLRCEDGQAPKFQRLGSDGLGPYGQIIDSYQVDCVASAPLTSVLSLDMYHPTHVETLAPAGFTIVAP